MKVEIITIGDELLWGQIADTNAVYLGRRLAQLGLKPQWLSTVGDRPDRIAQVLSLALHRADLILMTGGLGPTEDDVTRKALAQALGRRLVLDERVLKDLRDRVKTRGGTMHTGDQAIALLPQVAKILKNPKGQAPGLLLEIEEKVIYALPGVPLEMQAIFEQEVTPLLERIPAEKALRRRLRTVGIGESAIEDRLRGLSLKDISLAYLPRPWAVDLWLTARPTTFGEAEALLLRASGEIEKRLEDHVYGFDDDTLERVVATLMIMRGLTIAVSESCTGGSLASRLTDVPGSSAYFERGVVAYSNEAKRQLLKVHQRTLTRFGAVSEETAVAMAEGVRKISGTSLGLSTTGIAGPSGATAEKPVGLTFIGLAHEGNASAKRFLFGRDRKTNKECCVRAALDTVRRHLINL